MNQVWSPLECNEPDLRLWSLNVVALLHSENEKMMAVVVVVVVLVLTLA